MMDVVRSEVTLTGATVYSVPVVGTLKRLKACVPRVLTCIGQSFNTGGLTT
jgi:hypothetical protein